LDSHDNAIVELQSLVSHFLPLYLQLLVFLSQCINDDSNEKNKEEEEVGPPLSSFLIPTTPNV
jgi:hypothetical protein